MDGRGHMRMLIVPSPPSARFTLRKQHRWILMLWAVNASNTRAPSFSADIPTIVILRLSVEVPPGYEPVPKIGSVPLPVNTNPRVTADLMPCHIDIPKIVSSLCNCSLFTRYVSAGFGARTKSPASITACTAAVFAAAVLPEYAPA